MVINDHQVNEAAFSYYARLERLKRYVDGHYFERIDLQTAASVAGLEVKYFSVFFHAKTGIRFREWLSRQRVERAMEQMARQNHSITELAQMVGFQDLRTFERAFKKQTGMTPLAYKKSVRPC